MACKHNQLSMMILYEPLNHMLQSPVIIVGKCVIQNKRHILIAENQFSRTQAQSKKKLFNRPFAQPLKGICCLTPSIWIVNFSSI